MPSLFRASVPILPRGLQVAPIQAAWQEASEILRARDAGARAPGALLIVGGANAGKTRLAWAHRAARAADVVAAALAPAR
jgi:hypothetical protein